MWQIQGMEIPNSTLELRSVPFPRQRMSSLLMQQPSYYVTLEKRHYLGGFPVHCGEMLEVYIDGEWLLGRYDWTAMPGDEPTIELYDRVLWLDGTQLLRWPLRMT